MKNLLLKSLLTCCFSSTIRLRTRGTVKAKLEKRNVKAKVEEVSEAAPDHSEGGSKEDLDDKEKVNFWRVLVWIRHCLVSIHLPVIQY